MQLELFFNVLRRLGKNAQKRNAVVNYMFHLWETEKVILYIFKCKVCLFYDNWPLEISTIILDVGYSSRQRPK